jgi:hypothetical protein
MNEEAKIETTITTMTIEATTTVIEMRNKKMKMEKTIIMH